MRGFLISQSSLAFAEIPLAEARGTLLLVRGELRLISFPGKDAIEARCASYMDILLWFPFHV
jgi:hypothetical protein